MTDENPDWIPLDEAVAHVEATQQCYRQRAIDLIREAADVQRLKSRTVHFAQPRWVISILEGKEVFHEMTGGIEVCRQDMLRLWPEHKTDAIKSVQSRIRGQITLNNVIWAIEKEFPAGHVPEGLTPHDRNMRIEKRLKESGRSVPLGDGLKRAVQRAFKKIESNKKRGDS